MDKNARIGAGVRLVNEADVRRGVFGRFAVRDDIAATTKNAIISDLTIC